MTVHDWVRQQVAQKGCLPQEFFVECWKRVFPLSKTEFTPRRHAQEYARRNGVVPVAASYVWSCFEQWQRQRYTMPPQAVKTSRWAGNYHRGTPTDALKLVDDSSLLVARKGRDGVWRCT